MGKTKQTGVHMNLAPEKAVLLSKLAKETRIPKSVLMREAIDDLLIKYGKLKLRKKP